MMGDPTSAAEAIRLVRDITLTGALIYVLWASGQRKWYWSHYVIEMKEMYERLLKEEKERTAYWQAHAVKSMNQTSETVLKATEAVANLPKSKEH